jgi:hypothetical protein
VPAHPYELACFPQSWFRFLQLPVVSYALPARMAGLLCVSSALRRRLTITSTTFGP